MHAAAAGKDHVCFCITDSLLLLLWPHHQQHSRPVIGDVFSSVFVYADYSITRMKNIMRGKFANKQSNGKPNTLIVLRITTVESMKIYSAYISLADKLTTALKQRLVIVSLFIKKQYFTLALK